MQTFLFKNQTVLYKISLNSVFMILFRMYNVSVFCILCGDNGNVWVDNT